MSKLLDIDTNRYLLEILSQYNIELYEIEGFYFANNQYPGIRALAFEMEKRGDNIVVQLDIQLLLPRSGFTESFVGYSDDVEEAIADAFEQFEVVVLPTLIKAFWEDAKIVDRGVGSDIWDINGNRWQIVMSSYGYRGSDNFDNIIDDSDTIYDTIEQHIKSLPLEDELYALRVSYSNMQNGNRFVEVLLNNKEFIELEEDILNLNWKDFGNYYNVRVFMLIMKLFPEDN